MVLLLPVVAEDVHSKPRKNKIPGAGMADGLHDSSVVVGGGWMVRWLDGSMVWRFDSDAGKAASNGRL